MQFLNAIAILHTMAGMLGIHKLYVRYLEHKRWMGIGVYYVLLPV